MKKCAYWTGLKCQQEIASFSRSTTIMNETGAIFPPEMNLGSKVYRDYEFSTSVQEYSFFEFDIEKPERDIAFVVTITDAGTDVDIFASQDVINPTASSSNGYKWIADDVNTATSKKEVLQICGAFGYSTDSEGRPVPRAGSAGGDTKCSKQDANVKQGKMYVGVLSHLNQLSLTQSTYKIEIKIDKCNPASCIAGNGDCDSSTGDCICKIYSGTTNPIWTGTDCSSPKCPSPTKGDNKGIPCSGNGDCVIGSKDILGSEDNKPFCMCHPGYKTINNTVCDLPVDNQRVPTQINAETVFSATGFTYSSSAVGNEGTSLALGKYQMYYVTFPEPFTAVTVNVTGKQAIDRDDSAVSVLSSGRPDMLVAATRGKALAPTFENIDLTSFDYDGWVTRDLESHDAIFRTTRPNEKWYITILSTAYARSALDYKIRIKGTAPTSTNAGDCSKLSWEYRTCSGGKGTCVVGQDSTPICTECKVDENKGAFSYVGKTCGQKVYPVPSYQLNDNTVSEDSKILQPGSVYTSGANFGPLSDSSSLEPGEWEYFVVDTRANYISLTFKMSIKNTLLVQNSGVLAPLMLIKSAAGGASLPSLDTDPNTFYDFEGAQIGEQLVTIENTDNVPIADRYYVAVYNQRYSGAALEYSLEITSRHPSTGVRVIRIPLVPFLFPDIYSSSFIIIELTFFYLNLLLVLFSFFFFLFSFFVTFFFAQDKPTCKSSPCSTHSSSCEDDAAGRKCTCHPAWTGPTCDSPVLRSTSSLLMAASGIISLGNNDNVSVPMKRGDFRFFKVPQPLKSGQGVILSVCDTSSNVATTAAPTGPVETDRRRTYDIDFNEKFHWRRLQSIDMGGACCEGSGCSDPDIYVSSELPRTSYDFGLIGASPNGSKEELVVYNSSSTGRYYLAIYANNPGTFLVATKATTVPPSPPLATEQYFFALVGEWLTTEVSGIITLIVLCILMCVLCTGCMFACCCEHESLHKHHDEKPTSFKGKAAATFGKFIGSRHHDHNHHTNVNGSVRNGSMRSFQAGPTEQERFNVVGGAQAGAVSVQMTNMHRNQGSSRNKTTI